MLHDASIEGGKEKTERRQALLTIDNFIVNGIHLGIHSPVHDNKRAQKVAGVVLGDIVIEIRPVALIPSVLALVTRNVIDF